MVVCLFLYLIFLSSTVLLRLMLLVVDWTSPSKHYVVGCASPSNPSGRRLLLHLILMSSIALLHPILMSSTVLLRLILLVVDRTSPSILYVVYCTSPSNPSGHRLYFSF